MSFDQIIILGVLTTLIFILTWLSFSSIYGQIKSSVELGQADEEIKVKLGQVKKKSKLNAIFNIFSLLIVLALTGMGVIVTMYQRTNNQVVIDGKVVMVVASDSMSAFYNDKYEEQLLENKSDAENQQFKVGDITVFELIDSEEELVPYEVYGYKTTKKVNGEEQEVIIIHRYIESTSDGNLIFRGDNTSGRDNLVTRDQVLYHYTEAKAGYVGNFVLFFRSIIGMGTIIAVIILYVMAEIYAKKYKDLLNKRTAELSDELAKQNESSVEETVATSFLETVETGIANISDIEEEEVNITYTENVTEIEAPYVTYVPIEETVITQTETIKEPETVLNNVENPLIELGRKKLFKIKQIRKASSNKSLSVGALAEFDRRDGTHVIIYPKGSGKKCIARKALRK